MLLGTSGGVEVHPSCVERDDKVVHAKIRVLHRRGFTAVRLFRGSLSVMHDDEFAREADTCFNKYRRYLARGPLRI